MQFQWLNLRAEVIGICSALSSINCILSLRLVLNYFSFSQVGNIFLHAGQPRVLLGIIIELSFLPFQYIFSYCYPKTKHYGLLLVFLSSCKVNLWIAIQLAMSLRTQLLKELTQTPSCSVSRKQLYIMKYLFSIQISNYLIVN
jgi:hypothetical protein